MPLDSNQVGTKVTALKMFWDKRNKKFKEWYEQIRMVDTLAQKDMESFVGNDPRASFNLISNLLNQRIPHRLQPETLELGQIAPAAELSKMFDTMWQETYDGYRLRGREFLDDLINFLLVTGWYAVFASITLNGSATVAEVWNPATVFPMWDDELAECAHIFTPGEVAVRRLAERNGWELGFNPGNYTTIYDYWWAERQLTRKVIHNAILVDSTFVKEDTIELRFDRIPIFVSPVGGLPDTGELATRKTADWWKQEIGQAFVATNENIIRTSNKWWTFILQLLRDTAQARTFERSSGAQQIVKPETWYRRGAHYKLGPNDEVGFINPPAIPMEIRGAQLDLEAMIGRGGPSPAMYGQFQQRMTTYAMTQIVATTHQVSRSYHKGVINCITDIDNFWYSLIKRFGYKPYGIALPNGLPERARLTADYELRVAGDMVGKATTARMLNPAFELSDEYIIERLFPEIKNPTEELARVRASKARKSPEYAQISLIEGFRQEAKLLDNEGDHDAAALYNKVADRMEQQIVGEPQSPEKPPKRVRARPEVVPPGMSEKAFGKGERL